MANRYCPRCLHSFPSAPDRCPNLACNQPRPEGGWGRLHAAGDLLDRTYRVSERIAVGGAGITYRARELDDLDEEIGPELAIKVLFHNAEGTILRRLSTEARVLQELQHPHIVQCRGFVHRTGKPAYLVMKYEAGGNLYDHVRHVGALPIDVATTVATQVLEALSVAHRRDVIHRDLKPQNILLREAVAREVEPHVLLADFGIAKVSGFVGDNLTVAGTFVGTPEFAAPEQFKGLQPTAQTDVYAAAAVFWYCLTGAPPLVFANRSDAVDCLRTLREELPPRLPDAVSGPRRERLQQVFDHTLVFDAKARWTIPTFLEALAELDEDAPASEPLFTGTMGTMTPDALFDLEPEPEEPASFFDEPEPEPAPPPRPPRPRPEPSRPPPGRTERQPLPSQPLPRQQAVSSMDALFERIEDAPLDEAPQGLEDFFGGSSTPAVEEASWETLHHGAAAPAEAAAAPAPDWEPENPEPVGNPSSDADRIRALGRCSAADRPALLDALENPEQAIQSAGTDVSSRCGASLAARHHQIERHAPRALSMLQHADPDVRATAALALGALGRPAQLTQLNRLLSDPEPRVRRAAVHALYALGQRTSRLDLALEWLVRHHDTDDAVQAALADYTSRR